jgi:PncC family amidohydrolase
MSTIDPEILHLPSWLNSSPVLGLWTEAKRIAPILMAKGLTVATAESLTGGWLSAALTSVAGSSAYFKTGLTVYSNESKIGLLSVPKEVIESHGAVSKQCAQYMARGVQAFTQSTFGLATTGIAGPDGGSREKPVGLVFTGVSDGSQVWIRRHCLEGNRLEITLEAGCQALALFYEILAARG